MLLSPKRNDASSAVAICGSSVVTAWVQPTDRVALVSIAPWPAPTDESELPHEEISAATATHATVVTAQRLPNMKTFRGWGANASMDHDRADRNGVRGPAVPEM